MFSNRCRSHHWCCKPATWCSRGLGWTWDRVLLSWESQSDLDLILLSEQIKQKQAWAISLVTRYLYPLSEVHMGSISSQRESSRVYTPILPMGGMLDFLCNRANQKISWILDFLLWHICHCPFTNLNWIFENKVDPLLLSCCKFHNFISFKKLILVFGC